MLKKNIEDYKAEFFRDHKRLHLNNAGLAPISKPARDKIHYWGERFYQEGFYTDHDYMNDVQQSRASLATLIGCTFSEVAFFQSTASAISQLCFHFPLAASDEVLTWDQEYSSNLYPWQEACKRAGAKFIIVPSEKNLTTPVEKIIEKITAQTKVIAISWVQFLTGSITDIKTLSKITKEKKIFLFVDVMQGLGLHPFNMKEWGVDAVAGGSHKWLTSPVGVGFLALDMKHMNKIKPHNVGAYTFGPCDDPTDLACTPKTDALKFEAGSKQVLEITALGASVDLILKTTVLEIEKEALRLSNILYTGLLNFGYEVHYNKSSIVNFIPRSESAMNLAAIPCNFALRGPGIRLSPHAFNTDQDIEKVLKALSN
jgi:cysteine desulfurase/selenocysteine lyase